MDFDSMKKAGQRLGTGGIMVFDHKTCLVAATVNLLEYFARESCGWCTPCREGLPYILELLRLIEHGEGRNEYITMIRAMAGHMNKAYCAFAPGAAEPVLGLLNHFEDEVREHISQKKCPLGMPDISLRPDNTWFLKGNGRYPGTDGSDNGGASCPI
jgi:NADH-quinone oxidoreductase subunit F